MARTGADACGAAMVAMVGSREKTNIMDDEMRARFDRIDRRLDAVFIRLDEQDAGHVRLMGKVDRLSVRVDQLSTLSHAGEEAMTSLDALSRRIARLES